MSYVRTSAVPRPGDTTARVDSLHTFAYDGRTVQITSFDIDDKLCIQFDSLALAWAWLAECARTLTAAVEARAANGGIAVLTADSFGVAT